MVRDFEKSDLKICAQLLTDAYNCGSWNNHWTVETAIRYLNEFILSKDFIGFGIEKNDEVIGAMFSHRKT